MISVEEIQTWIPGDTIIIEAGTDTGKSYFIKNRLYEFAARRGERILMLLHRRACVNQFRAEIKRDGKAGVLDIMTYQALESSSVLSSLSQYRYIISDEYHYFVSDARFNVRTDISYRAIMECKTAVRILMSATGADVEAYINHVEPTKTKKYFLPRDWSFISELTFFYRDESLEVVAKDVIENNGKAIFFIEKASKAYKLFKKFERNAVFNCSKSNQRFYEYVDEDTIEKILCNQKFETNLLITTSCMDAGVNIIDPDLKTIVIDMRDVGSLIQCMGRKRQLNAADTVHIMIKAINNKQLGGYLTNTRREIEQVEYLRKNGTEAYIRRYYREFDRTRIIYDELVEDGSKLIEKRINELRYYKKRCDIYEYEEMLRLGAYGYCKYLAKKFDRYDSDGREYKYKIYGENHSLISYLKSRTGDVMLCRKDRTELIEKLNVRRDGHLKHSIEILNDALKEDGIPFGIEEFPVNVVIDGKRRRYKSAWRIVERN